MKEAGRGGKRRGGGTEGREEGGRKGERKGGREGGRERGEGGNGLPAEQVEEVWSKEVAVGHRGRAAVLQQLQQHCDRLPPMRWSLVISRGSRSGHILGTPYESEQFTSRTL